mmetsp:Transcript_2353/g.4975  ORF Transcript_2353/g.4975 Transcript_2353/m.4975 type:complete len:205 (+) Transcript_2353:549-1163(+)
MTACINRIAASANGKTSVAMAKSTTPAVQVSTLLASCRQWATIRSAPQRHKRSAKLASSAMASTRRWQPWTKRQPVKLSSNSSAMMTSNLCSKVGGGAGGASPRLLTPGGGLVASGGSSTSAAAVSCMSAGRSLQSSTRRSRSATWASLFEHAPVSSSSSSLSDWITAEAVVLGTPCACAKEVESADAAWTKRATSLLCTISAT